MKIKFLCLVFLFVSSVSFAKNKIFFYEPEMSTLEGVIEIYTFPGPPNYGNISQGDAAETCAYLNLDFPINVKASPNIKGEMWMKGSEKNILEIQLAAGDRDYSKLENGFHVRVTGELYHRETGHHHTRVLMFVRDVKILPKTREFSQERVDAINDYIRNEW